MTKLRYKKLIRAITAARLATALYSMKFLVIMFLFFFTDIFLEKSLMIFIWGVSLTVYGVLIGISLLKMKRWALYAWISLELLFIMNKFVGLTYIHHQELFLVNLAIIFLPAILLIKNPLFVTTRRPVSEVEF